MKKLSLLLALVLTGITFFSCMQDAPSEPPKGILTVKNPLNNDGFAVGDVINAEASAVMIDLAKIEFYIDGSLKATDDSSPYLGAIPTTGLSAGTHSVKIVAFGADGSLEQTVPVTLVTGNPPSCTITAPADYANIKIGTAVDITATASDADGSVASVSFYANNVLISTDTSSPYAASWSTTGLGEGVYTLKATAKDNMGITKSDEVTTNLFLSVPPNVTITSPADGASIELGTIPYIRASASDIDGFIIEVRFYNDGVLLGVDTTYHASGTHSYESYWNTAGSTIGNHTIKVVAKDNSGKEAEKSVTVVLAAKPTVTTAAITNITTTAANGGGNVTADGGSAVTARGVCWSISGLPVVTGSHSTDGASSGTFVSSLTGLTKLTRYIVRAYATNAIGTSYGDTVSFRTKAPWMQKASLPTISRFGSVGFAINNKGYLGTGCYQTSTGSYGTLKDFWEYDPISNQWTQKADFGGDTITYAVGFAIGNRGYIGTGKTNINGVNYKRDFWEYNPSSNIWIRKADFGGVARMSATGFSIGNKGYIGTGLGSSGRYKDLWEFDPVTNIWIKKTDFSGIERDGAVGFSIDNKGYIGTGTSSTGELKDFWEFNPTTNNWIKKADFGGVKRYRPLGFSINIKGYIGGGNTSLGGVSTNDFWEYDPITNVWLQKSPNGGLEAGFSISSKGYGFNGQTLYEYDPSLDQ